MHFILSACLSLFVFSSSLYAAPSAPSSPETIKATSKPTTKASSDASAIDNKRVVAYDWPVIEVAVAEYDKGPTGTTMVHFTKGAHVSVDEAGGAASTFQVPEWFKAGTGYVDAITLSGGSIFGLEASTGVLHSLFKERGEDISFNKIPIVSGAIVYDFIGRTTTNFPDKALGEQAWKRRAHGKVPVGRVGGGRNTSVGKLFGLEYREHGGQGASFLQIGEYKFLVITVVNSLGAIYNEKGEVLRGYYNPTTQKHFDITEGIQLTQNVQASPIRMNTTITVVVTNQTLNPRFLRQMGKQIHAAMGQIIRPYASIYDGDVLYCVSTQEIPEPEVYDNHILELGTIAGEVAKLAVWNSIGYEPADNAIMKLSTDKLLKSNIVEGTKK